jgi:hypothetical protein
LKETLKEILYPTISEKTQDKKHIKSIVSNVLDALIRHDYLVENHPQRAGGGEALRTSYSVGEQYHKALNDYYKVKGRKDRDFQVEVLEREGEGSHNLQDIFPEENRKYIVPKDNLIDALSREFGDFNYDVFKITQLVKEEDYSNAIQLNHELIKKYIRKVYRHFYNKENVYMEEFNSFLGELSSLENFPFTKKELIDFIDQYQFIRLDDPNVEELAQEISNSLFRFSSKIFQFLNKK